MRCGRTLESIIARGEAASSLTGAGSNGDVLVLELARAPLEELCQRLQAPDPAVRRAAVRACLLRPEKELNDGLRRLRDDPDPGVVEAARDALRRRVTTAR
jgi:HEAT repeat protein